MPLFDLRTLGPPEIRRLTPDSDREPGSATTILGPGKPLAVVAYLHCAPGHAATREQLVELLWADVPAEGARHPLRQTLWYIKRRLGVDPFSTSADLVRLTAELPSDRTTFLTALDQSDHEAAVAAYTGDFFPGFAAPGGAAFEQWADVERTRLRSLYIGAVGRVVRTRLETGRAREALTVARTARDLVPTAQATWRMLLECHLAATDLIGAKVEVERLTQWLAADEMEPEPATAQLIRLVESGRPAPVTSPAPGTASQPPGLTPELVGRDLAFSRLVQAYELAARGTPQHVHISAAAGLGKSRLLEGLAARIRSQRGQRPRVVAVQAIPAERALPYGFAAHLAGALVTLRGAAAVSPDAASTLVALAPGASAYLSATPDPSTGDEALRRRALAVGELVAAVADDATVALLVDDVHWMDGQSRALLAALAARADQARLLLVTAGRPVDRFAESTPRAPVLTLDPLSVDDVGALIMSIARLPNEPWAESLAAQVAAAAGGSPLLVLETLQLALEQGQLSLRDAMWECTAPEDLAAMLGAGRALQQRLATLPPAAREALLRLAVAGAPIADTDLEFVLPADARESLALLDARGFVERSNEHSRPAHDEIAAMAVDLASTADRTRAHQAVAEWLERSSGTDQSRLARAIWHRARASDTPAVDRAFARLVELAEAGGDVGAHLGLAREALGVDANSAELEALVGRLPRRLRVRRWPWALMGAAAAVLAAGWVAMAPRRDTATPDVSFTALVVDAAGSEQWAEARVNLSALGAADYVDLEPVRPLIPQATLATLIGVRVRLDDGTFVGDHLDTTTKDNALDLVRIAPDGRLRPIAPGPRDQSDAMLSPDGRWLAFSDRSGSPNQEAHVALLDLQRDSIVALSASTASEETPVWAPEGTRVVFLRLFGDSTPSQLCTIGADGRGERCAATPSDMIPLSILAWRRDESVLIAAEYRTGRRALIQHDLRTASFALVDSSGGLYGSDPLGQLVLCQCRIDGFDREVPAVFAPDRPQTKRPLRLRQSVLRAVQFRVLFWHVTSSPLAALRLDVADTVTIGERLQLKVRGLDAKGRELAVPARRWRSLDPDVATIDSAGIVTGVRSGRARVVVSAGRTLADTLRLTVESPRVTKVLAEEWKATLAGQWIDFGQPAPVLRRAGARSVLHINGDSRLTSGVVSRLAFDGRRGLALQVPFRLPITAPQWQALYIDLDPFATDSALAAWSGRTEGLFNSQTLNPSCSLRLPRGEGGAYRAIASVVVGAEDVIRAPATPPFGDGNWHTADIQLFADGRCAVAIDGVLLGVSQSSLPLDAPFRVVIHGQSVDTDVAVGAITLSRGVRVDGPWQERPR